MSVGPDGYRAVLQSAARSYRVSEDEVLGKSKMLAPTAARKVVVAALRHRGETLTDIGRFLGRDHSTVYHHARRTQGERRADPVFEAAVDEALRCLGGVPADDVALLAGDTGARKRLEVAIALADSIERMGDELVRMAGETRKQARHLMVAMDAARDWRRDMQQGRSA